jgi:hypothetical protein
VARKRSAPKSITIDSNVRCLRVYPTEDTDKGIENLETVGIRLSGNQAVHLARVLLAVTQDWNDIEITAYRFERRRSDQTYRLTVTSRRE